MFCELLKHWTYKPLIQFPTQRFSVRLRSGLRPFDFARPTGSRPPTGRRGCGVCSHARLTAGWACLTLVQSRPVPSCPRSHHSSSFPFTSQRTVSHSAAQKTQSPRIYGDFGGIQMAAPTWANDLRAARRRRGRQKGKLCEEMRGDEKKGIARRVGRAANRPSQKWPRHPGRS